MNGLLWTTRSIGAALLGASLTMLLLGQPHALKLLGLGAVIYLGSIFCQAAFLGTPE